MILRKIWILSAVILCAAAYAKERPNFVIVLADDVSWSSFGCNESGLYTRTPNIDKLASQGVRFTNFMGAVAQCGPLRHELYTGLLPPSSGVYSNGSKPKESYKNIAHYLGDLGYNVGLTGKTHFNVADFHKVSGFETNGNHNAPTWEMGGIKQFIESSQSEQKPFCVVVASVNAHHPWTVGDPSNFPLDKIVVPPHMVDTPVTREALARHAAEVEELDNQVGATMELLDDMELADDTVLIFLSEQGTALPNGKWSIYDYGTRALCVVRWPGKVEPAVSDAVAMYCDISSTLVDIAGGEAPATDGKSLFSVLKGETSHHRDYAYLIHQAGGYTQRAIRNKDFKLVWNPERKADYYLDVLMEPKSGKFFARAWREWLGKAKTDPDAQAKIDRVVKHPEFELYNVKGDPWELENLADNPEYRPQLEKMHAQLKADMERMNDVFSTVDPKKLKREKKARVEQTTKTEQSEPAELTEKQKKREARKLARQKS
ncbi:sulfatase family protein [Pelagicoccus mobilis]|uniref:Sulfatase-like hydrolase/transferase n=1 Tax=Pelagicoccus mobilis TaxID=415221 RepID=A0A934RY63_9BACT|nr:sulfatase [Pelagicoccus mobilis]MBK1876507.1 sulfatase-like hydrolase/transferase [Pelagicoccus mobilis]